MRRIHYLFPKSIEKNLLKKRINLLEPEAQRRYLSNRRFLRIYNALYFSMVAIIFILSIFIALLIESGFGRVIFLITASIFAFIIPAVVFHTPYTKYEKKYPRQLLGNIPRDTIAKSTSPLFRFYRIPDNFLITKCFDCSNHKLIDKDLILFFYEGKLRIVNDFTSTVKDFGCYQFQMDEIEYGYEPKNHLITTVIKSKKFTISIGARAKSFISKRGVLDDEKKQSE